MGTYENNLATMSRTDLQRERRKRESRVGNSAGIGLLGGFGGLMGLHVRINGAGYDAVTAAQEHASTVSEYVIGVGTAIFIGGLASSARNSRRVASINAQVNAMDSTPMPLANTFELNLPVAPVPMQPQQQPPSTS